MLSSAQQRFASDHNLVEALILGSEFSMIHQESSLLAVFPAVLLEELPDLAR
jgi:hypothetical protein